MKANVVLVAVATLLMPAAVLYAQYDVPPTNSPTPRPQLNVSQLPAAAQATVRKKADGKNIAKISEETYSGHRAYRVEFKESGRNPDILVAEDGSILRPEEKPSGIMGGASIEKTPPAVQSAIKASVGAGEVTKIEQEGHRSERRYRIQAKDERGIAFELEIARDGKVVLDTRQAGKPTGR